MCRDVILVGESADVLYAQQEDGHEEGGHRRGSALKRPSIVFDLLLFVGNHVFAGGECFSGQVASCEGRGADGSPFAFYEK